MALIPCSECGRDVSDKAAACPGCGNPIQNAVPKPAITPALGKTTKNLLLEKEIGQLGGKADSIAETSGGMIMGAVCDALGARLGAEWMAKRLKSSEHTDSVVYDSSLSNAVANARIVLSNIGKIVDMEIDHAAPFLAATVGSGFLNMNPAIVCLEFISLDETRTKIVISATAKEGLIKQKTAEKVVAKIKGLLSG